MTPQNAERALYSDILNLSVAREEYAQLADLLTTVTRTYQVRELLDRFDEHDCEGVPLVNNPRQTGLAWKMGRIYYRGISPLQRLETSLHIPSTYLVIPAFALANAAIPLDLGSIEQALSEPIAIGIIVGLVFGKLIGVAGSVLLARRLGLGQLPEGVTPSHVLGAGLLAGIGFTMSIFISELAFQWDGETVVVAKMGIFFGSLLAGIGGYLWLRYATPDATKAPAAKATGVRQSP
jgi:NhaA family Na+:H+ antiporter